MRPVGRQSTRPRVGAPDGPGGDEFSGERGEDGGDFPRAGGVEGGRDVVRDGIEDSSRARSGRHFPPPLRGRVREGGRIVGRRRRLSEARSRATPGRSASASSRSTVSPTVRQGASWLCPSPLPAPPPQGGRESALPAPRPRPLPRLREITIQRIEPKPKIIRERAKQRRIARLAAAARHARRAPPASPRAAGRPAPRPAHAARRGSAAPSGRRYARRALPERRLRSPFRSRPRSWSKPCRSHEIDDLRRDQLRAARIARLGRSIFVDQRLDLRRRSIAFGARHRRHQMIDDDRSACAASPARPRPDR